MISMRFSIVFMTILISVVMSQRSPYAGSRPSGYKDRFRPQDNANTTDNEIVNRFGQNELDVNATQKPPVQGIPIVYGEPIPSNQNIAAQTTNVQKRPEQLPSTQPTRIPIDAYGDIELLNRISSLPIEHQPFWFINYQAIEAQRNRTGNNFNFNPISSRSSFLGK